MVSPPWKQHKLFWIFVLFWRMWWKIRQRGNVSKSSQFDESFELHLCVFVEHCCNPVSRESAIKTDFKAQVLKLTDPLQFPLWNMVSRHDRMGHIVPVCSIKNKSCRAIKGIVTHSEASVSRVRCRTTTCTGQMILLLVYRSILDLTKTYRPTVGALDPLASWTMEQGGGNNPCGKFLKVASKGNPLKWVKMFGDISLHISIVRMECDTYMLIPGWCANKQHKQSKPIDKPIELSTWKVESLSWITPRCSRQKSHSTT